MENDGDLTLTVKEASKKDVGRGIARIAPRNLKKLGIEIGDIIKIEAKNFSMARVMPVKKEKRREDIIQIDGIIRKNVDTAIDKEVSIKKGRVRSAQKVIFSSLNKNIPSNFENISEILENIPITLNDRVRVTLMGANFINLKVNKILPSSPAIISKDTQIEIEKNLNRKKEKTLKKGVTYEDIGGLKEQIGRIREMIELPLKYPQIFTNIGIEPPKGVLLHGPPGTGKTLIARAVANETNAYFISLNGPEIINKYYGESEAQLRKVFEKAERKAPGIIFIDEIDAIAQKRAETKGEVEKRVVAQLLGLMDGLKRRGQVIVIGATNIVNSLDPALRRPGRFDREISTDVPDKKDRKEILNIHTRGINLAEDINLDKISEMTHGFVGADLESLVREAAMKALRTILPHFNIEIDQKIHSKLKNLSVKMEDFLDALSRIQPSALKEVFVEISSVGWEDVGGLKEIKNSLIETIEWPFKYADLFNQAGVNPPSGILLFGSPGTGKTLLAKACANESNVNFIAVKSPMIFSKWVGESEKRLREIFKKARQSAPCIVFFDEIEAIASKRSGSDLDSGVQERALSQLLNELDGIEELQGVVVIGATNKKELIDSALLRPGRFDLQFELKSPNARARKEIFEIHTHDKPLARDVNIDKLVEQSEGFVGADIESLCQKATMRAIRAFIKENRGDISDFRVKMEDFKKEITIMKDQLKNNQEG